MEKREELLWNKSQSALPPTYHKLQDALALSHHGAKEHSQDRPRPANHHDPESFEGHWNERVGLIRLSRRSITKINRSKIASIRDCEDIDG